jgi:serine/threonine protein kinase
MIIHRDLKSLNMLLDKPVTGELKPRHSNGVVDF